MRKAFKVLVFLTGAVILAACSEVQDELEIFKDDVDSDANNRTLDIRISQAEEVILSSLHAAFLSHLYLPFFDFLDVSDIPDSAVPDGDGFRADCAISGSASYHYSMADEAEQVYRSGDTFTVSYQDCMNEEGVSFNGSARWKYSKIEGLNNRFELIDSETCLARLDRTFDNDYRIIENRDEEGEYFWADDVQIFRTKDKVEVRYLELTVFDEEENYEVVHSVVLGANAVIIIRALEEDPDRSDEGVTRFRLASGGYPSSDGDEFYSLRGTNWEKENCQAFRRHASVKVSGLTADLEDGTQYTITETFNAYEDSDGSSTPEHTLSSKELDITWIRGVAQAKFRFMDFTVAKRVSAESGAYSFRADGDYEYPGKGIARFQTNNAIMAQGRTEAPHRGGLTILGQNFESIDVAFFPFDLLIRVDKDGDNNGDNQPDDDAVQVSYWQDLLDGVFRLVP